MSVQEEPVLSLHEAWRRRDPDRQFTSVDSCLAYLLERMQHTEVLIKSLQKMPLHSDQYGVYIQGKQRLDFSYLAFSQLCRVLHNHPKCVRRYSPLLASQMLTEELSQRYRGPSHHRVMIRQESLVSAINGPTYGTIWDYEVLKLVSEIDLLQTWVPPSSLNQSPLATKLYAGDDGLYCFLLDPSRPVLIEEEPFYAGLLLVNSEVGTKRFEASTFVYRPSNHIRFPYIVQGIEQLLIRHSSYGPHRFAQEAPKLLAQFQQFTPVQLAAEVTLSKKQTLGRSKEKVLEVLRTRFSLTEKLARQIIETAEDRYDDYRSAWSLVNALCLYAQRIYGAKTSDRLALERTAQHILAAYSQ